MSCTYSEARDIMMQVFMDAWAAGGYNTENLRFTGVKSSPPGAPTSAELWARATIRHADGGQTSLSGQINGATKHTNFGTVIVQVFGKEGDGSTAAYDAAQIVASGYRNARAAVWFRRVRINEVGANGGFDQINVLADFEYDSEETSP